MYRVDSVACEKKQKKTKNPRVYILDQAACLFSTTLVSFNLLFLAAFYSAVFVVQLDSSFFNCPEGLHGQNGIIKQIEADQRHL